MKFPNNFIHIITNRLLNKKQETKKRNVVGRGGGAVGEGIIQIFGRLAAKKFFV